MSSPWVPRPRTPPSIRPAIRGISAASRAGPAGAPAAPPGAPAHTGGGPARHPPAVTGIVGHKPTYGAVSRYGLIAFSSSLDQAGPMARNVLDAALLDEATGGHDPAD